MLRHFAYKKRLFDIHDFFERFSKFWIENGVYNRIYETIHVAEPSGEYKCRYTR